MKFMEQLIGEGFQGYLCFPVVMANIIADVISQAACSAEWAAGYALPDTVFERVGQVMEELRVIKASENIADLLAGKMPCTCFTLSRRGLPCMSCIWQQLHGRLQTKALLSVAICFQSIASGHCLTSSVTLPLHCRP